MRKWHVEHRAEFDALVAAGHGEFRALRAKAKAESADIVPKLSRHKSGTQQEKKDKGRMRPAADRRVQKMGAEVRKGRREIRAQERKVQAVLKGLESMGLE
jgi:hypothetical protein